jgi:Ca2+/Na+ antiporter
MLIFGFLIVIFITVQVTNRRNDAKPTDEVLSFSRADSTIIFLLLVLAFVMQLVANMFNDRINVAITVVFLLVSAAVLMVVNMNREKAIKRKHDQIVRVYQALYPILGQVDPADIDFESIPFEMKENTKMHALDEVVVDLSINGIKANENSITVGLYNMNKHFPDFQWINTADFPRQRLTYKGLPKPPNVAKFPGTDYRPAGWIPLGLSGLGEVGWNISDPKDLGFSSYRTEDGKIPNGVDLPSAPQAITLGSTGGGKAIWEGQMVDLLDNSK